MLRTVRYGYRGRYLRQPGDPGQGRPSVPLRQELVRAQEEPLQGTGQEHRPVLHAVCPSQSGDCQAATLHTRRPRSFLTGEVL